MHVDVIFVHRSDDTRPSLIQRVEARDSVDAICRACAELQEKGFSLEDYTFSRFANERLDP